VARIGLSAPGWTFRLFQDAEYGAYWAAASDAAVPLAPGGQVAIAVTGLVPDEAAGQAQVWADYYLVDGIDDGVCTDTLTIARAAMRPVR
jgi:hypothetical protein